MKDEEKFQQYLCDLGRLVKEYALAAVEERAQHRDQLGQAFYDGYVLGFHRIVSLMQQQAVAFGIDRKELQLDGIEPDRDLVQRGRYQPLMPNAHGWLWCDRLQLWLGTWTGPFLRYQATWLRFYDAQEQVIPIYAEAAQQQVEAERQQAATERQRAEAAEAALAKLCARLAQVEGPSQW